MNLSVHGSSGNISGGNGQFSAEIESPTINANEDTDIPSFESTSTETTNDKQQRTKKNKASDIKLLLHIL